MEFLGSAMPVRGTTRRMPSGRSNSVAPPSKPSLRVNHHGVGAALVWVAHKPAVAVPPKRLAMLISVEAEALVEAGPGVLVPVQSQLGVELLIHRGGRRT